MWLYARYILRTIRLLWCDYGCCRINEQYLHAADKGLTTPTSDRGRVQVTRSVLGVCTLVSHQTCYSANRIYDQLDWLLPVLHEGLWSSRIIVVIGEEFEHLHKGWSSVVIIDCTEYVSASQNAGSSPFARITCRNDRTGCDVVRCPSHIHDVLKASIICDFE